MLSRNKQKQRQQQQPQQDRPVRHEPVHTTYESKDVKIPTDFLVKTPPDAEPITFIQIDWEKTPLPEFKGGYAVVLDNVLSRCECRQLIALAEESVPEKDRVPFVPSTAAATTDEKAEEETSAESAPSTASSWRPAMVNIGGGFEVLEPTYRNSDRIVWDHQELLDRLWTHRLSTVPEIRDGPLMSFKQGDLLGYPSPRRWAADKRAYVPDLDPGMRWEFVRMNKRMRFLKYGPGQFFRAHCDGAYSEMDEGLGAEVTTHFTVHLYLNDSQQAILTELERKNKSQNGSKSEKEGEDVGERNKEVLERWELENNAGEKVDLVGGATSFLSNDEERMIDVDPRAGRVLIFQHKRLYHSGDDVLKGTKYTMRAELMYKRATTAEGTEGQA